MILLSTKNFKFLQIVVDQSGGSILPSPSEIQKYKNQQLNDSFYIFVILERQASH